MAISLAISPSYLNHLERNQRPVTAALLLKLAETYEIDVRTFASNGTEVVRLAYRPQHVVAGAALEQRADLAAEGYVVQPLDGGDYVIRIRHEHSRQIRIDG